MNITDLIMFEEGFREAPYYCSEGYPTVGIGQRIGPKNAHLSNYDFTVPVTVAKEWLRVHLVTINLQLHRNSETTKAYHACNDSRQAVLISMVYQLGFEGLLKFKKMLKAMGEHDWQTAHDEALDSKWAKQTPQRANRHALVLKLGDLEKVYN